MATPNTNIFLKEFCNGVKNIQTGAFHPFRTGSFAASDPAILGKPNIRYYIYRIVISGSTLVADAGTNVQVNGIWNQQAITLANYIKTTLVVNQFSQEYDCGILLDEQTDVKVIATTITSVAVQITWAEVDDLG